MHFLYDAAKEIVFVAFLEENLCIKKNNIQLRIGHTECKYQSTKKRLISL